MNSAQIIKILSNKDIFPKPDIFINLLMKSSYEDIETLVELWNRDDPYYVGTCLSKPDVDLRMDCNLCPFNAAKRGIEKSKLTWSYYTGGYLYSCQYDVIVLKKFFNIYGRHYEIILNLKRKFDEIKIK